MLSDHRITQLMAHSLDELERASADCEALVQLGATARLADLCDPEASIDILDRIADLAPSIVRAPHDEHVELVLADLMVRWNAVRIARGAAPAHPPALAHPPVLAHPSAVAHLPALAYLMVARDRAASLEVALGYCDRAAPAASALATAIGLVDRYIEDELPEIDAWALPEIATDVSTIQGWLAVASDEPAGWWCKGLLALAVRSLLRMSRDRVELIVDWLAGAPLSHAATWIPLPIRQRLARALAWDHAAGLKLPPVLESVLVPRGDMRTAEPPIADVTSIACARAREILDGFDAADAGVDQLALLRYISHVGHCIDCAVEYIPRRHDLYLAIACAAPAAQYSDATAHERAEIAAITEAAWTRPTATQSPTWLHPPLTLERKLTEWILGCGAPRHALAIVERLADQERSGGTRADRLGRAAEAAVALEEIGEAARLFAASLTQQQSVGMRALCQLLAPRAQRGEVCFGCPTELLLDMLDGLEAAGVGPVLIGTLALPDVRELACANDPIVELELLDRVVTAYVGVLEIMRRWTDEGGERKHSPYYRLEQRFAYPARDTGEESILRSLWLWCTERETGDHPIVAHHARQLRLGPLEALFRATSLARLRKQQIALARALRDNHPKSAKLARKLARTGQREKNRIEATLISRGLLYHGDLDDCRTIIAELEALQARLGKLDGQCLWYLGRAYQRIDRTRASAAFRAAAADLPDDERPTGLLFLIGETTDADASGDIEPGIAALETVLARDPSSQRARFVLGTLRGAHPNEHKRTQGARDLAAVFASAESTRRRVAVGLRLAELLARVPLQPTELGLPGPVLAELYDVLAQQRVFRFPLTGVPAAPGPIRYLAESLVTPGARFADWGAGRTMLLECREPSRAVALFLEHIGYAARRLRLDAIGRALVGVLVQGSGPELAERAQPRRELAEVAARLDCHEALCAYLVEVPAATLVSIADAWPEIAALATARTLAPELEAWRSQPERALVDLAVAREYLVQADQSRSYVPPGALAPVLQGAARRTRVELAFDSAGRYGLEDDLTSLDLLATAALSVPAIQALHHARVGVHEILDDDETIGFAADATPSVAELEHRPDPASSDRFVIQIEAGGRSALDAPLPRALLQARHEARPCGSGWSLRA